MPSPAPTPLVIPRIWCQVVAQIGPCLAGSQTYLSWSKNIISVGAQQHGFATSGSATSCFATTPVLQADDELDRVDAVLERMLEGPEDKKWPDPPKEEDEEEEGQEGEEDKGAAAVDDEGSEPAGSGPTRHGPRRSHDRDGGEGRGGGGSEEGGRGGGGDTGASGGRMSRRPSRGGSEASERGGGGGGEGVPRRGRPAGEEEEVEEGVDEDSA